MKIFILVFDIPRDEPVVKLKVNRNLHKIKAVKVQHSVWSSNELKELIDIATFIKNSGGSARILEEKLVFD